MFQHNLMHRRVSARPVVTSQDRKNGIIVALWLDASDGVQLLVCFDEDGSLAQYKAQDVKLLDHTPQATTR